MCVCVSKKDISLSAQLVIKGQRGGGLLNHSCVVPYSQLTLVSLDALGGAEALPRVDVANAGVAVALTRCRGDTRLGGGGVNGLGFYF